jgi:hypothetical protein
MKIVDNGITLTDGEFAFTIENNTSLEDKAKFIAWAHTIGGYDDMRIGVYYQAEMFGDIDYPAILIRKGAPKKLRTLCLLRWK